MVSLLPLRRKCGMPSYAASIFGEAGGALSLPTLRRSSNDCSGVWRSLVCHLSWLLPMRKLSEDGGYAEWYL